MFIKSKKKRFVYAVAAAILISIGCSAIVFAKETERHTSAAENKITASIIEYGQPLADSKIQVINDTTGKTYEWKDAACIPEAGTKEYEAVYYEKGESKDAGMTIKIPVTVSPKVITVTASDAERVYGIDNPEFVFAIAKESLVGTDTKDSLGLTLKTEADKDSKVGEYQIVKDTCTNANYDVTVTPGILTITKKLAELRVDNSVISYGEPLPTAFAYHVTGLAKEEDVDVITANLFTDATATSPSGIYRIAGTASAENYDVAVQAGTLKIEPNIVTAVDNLSTYSSDFIHRISVAGDIPISEGGRLECRNLDTTVQAHSLIQAEVGETEQLLLEGELSFTGTQIDQGSATLILPVGSEYDGQYVTVYHYVAKGDPDQNGIRAETAKLDVYENVQVQDGVVSVDVYSLSPFAVKLQKDGAVVTASPDKSDAVTTDVTAANKTKEKSVKTGDTLKHVIPYLVGCGFAVLIIIAILIRKKR